MPDSSHHFTRRFNSFSRAVLLLWILSILSSVTGCSHARSPAIVRSERITSQSDSLARMMMRYLVSSRSQSLLQDCHRIERTKETTVLNEHGDTTRHDTHTEITTAYVIQLEDRIRSMQLEIDSLMRLKSESDTVRIPEPYPVEITREVKLPANLTWWQEVRLHSWWLLAIALLVSLCARHWKLIVTLARRLINP